MKLQFPLTRTFYYGESRFYYGIGNTPATNLFMRSIDSQSSRFDICCVGCGDLRHVLFSLRSIREAEVEKLQENDKVVIVGLTSAKELNGEVGSVCGYLPRKQRYEVKFAGHRQGVSKLLKITNLKLVKDNSDIDKNISFFINDFDSHVVARNILFVECVRLGITSDTVFAIWFSIGLTKKQHTECRSTLKKLVSKYEKETNNSSENITFHCEEDRIKVVKIWKKWLRFSDESNTESLPSYDDVQKLRQETILHHFDQRQDNENPTSFLEFCRAKAQSWVLSEIVCDYKDEYKNFLKQWEDEQTQHLEAGNFNINFKKLDQPQKVDIFLSIFEYGNSSTSGQPNLVLET